MQRLLAAADMGSRSLGCFAVEWGRGSLNDGNADALVLFHLCALLMTGRFKRLASRIHQLGHDLSDHAQRGRAHVRRAILRRVPEPVVWTIIEVDQIGRR